MILTVLFLKKIIYSFLGNFLGSCLHQDGAEYLLSSRWLSETHWSDDEHKLPTFYEKFMVTEVAIDVLNEERKG